MNLRGDRMREDPEINFIPLIDVLLVILIFLMVTTTYQRFAELQLTLPEADANPPKERPHWDTALLGELSQAMADASICGLGQAAPNPLACVVKYFPHELEG